MHTIERPIVFSEESSLPEGTTKRDILSNALEELFFIEHPSLGKSDPSSKEAAARFVAQRSPDGLWMYYPWARIAIRMPPEDLYFRLRTARNRDLITESEQAAFRDSIVGVAGLSVGSSAVAALVASGGPRLLKIADHDTIDVSNLNRIRATLLDVGENKTDVAARAAWELDPFLDIDLWRHGISQETLDTFVGAPRLDVFIDEMDAIALKIAARISCKRRRIPVVMATDNGDGAIVDIERYDLEPERPIFNGRLGIPEENIPTIAPRDFLSYAIKIMDPSYFTRRQQQSILKLGKTLSGVAQLSTAATIAGAAAAFVVRRIVNKQDMPSGRYVIGCEQALIPGYNEPQQQSKRRDETIQFNVLLGLS